MPQIDGFICNAAEIAAFYADKNGGEKVTFSNYFLVYCEHIYESDYLAFNN